MSCKIEEMSWREILTFGIILDKKFYYNILKGSNRDKQKEMEEIIEAISNKTKSKEDLIRFLEDNSDIVDKVRYIMVINANIILKSGKSKNSGTYIEEQIHTTTRELLKDAHKKGKREEVVFGYEMSDEKEAIVIMRLDFLAEQSTQEDVRNREKQERKKKLLLGNKGLNVYEMICQNPSEVLFGLNLNFSTKKAFEYTAAVNSTEDRKELSEEDIERIKKLYPEAYCKELARLLNLNIMMLDMDDLILSSIKTNLKAINSPEIKLEEQEIISKRLQKLFEVGKKILQKGIVDNKKNIQEFKILEEQYKERVINGKYITKNNVQEVVTDLVNGKCRLRDVSKDILNMIFELPSKVFLLSKDNLIYGLQEGYLEGKKAYDLVVENGSCDTDILLYILTENLLTKNELIDLYMNKYVTLEQIRKIEENVGQLITLEDIIQKYEDEYETIQPPEYYKQEGYESFESLAVKVNALKEPGFECEKVEEAIYSMDSQELEVAILEFYKSYLVDAKIVYEACGIFCIKLLRPADVRDLYINKDIEIEDIKQAITGMDEERAIHFICQVFPGKEYSEELDFLIQSLHIEREETSRNPGNHRKKLKGVGGNKGKIDVSTIVYKYGFYEALDKDCVIEYIPKSGYSIFTLPNVKFKGTEEPCIVIEPMFDKSHKTQKTVAAQDKAMWILPISIWEKEKATIMGSDRRLNIGRIRELFSTLEKGKMLKIHHNVANLEEIKAKEEMIADGKVPKTGWPFRILGLATGSNTYTQEDLDKIMELGILLEKSMQRE